MTMMLMDDEQEQAVNLRNYHHQQNYLHQQVLSTRHQLLLNQQ
jgi:hypothetical protein